MTRASRIIRRGLWTMAVVLTLGWVATAFWGIYIACGSVRVNLARGGIGLMTLPIDRYQIHAQRISPATLDRWWVEHLVVIHGSDKGRVSRILPLWMPALAATLVAAWFQWRTRPRPVGGCTQCGYSLVGNTSGVCPECGEAIK